MDIRAVSIKAVILGFLADTVASTVGSIPVGIWYVMTSGSQSLEQMLEGMSTSALILSLSLAIGLLGTALGGYVAGLVAKAHQLLNASCVGILGIVFSLFFTGYPTWFNVAGYTLTIPAAMLGGKLSIRKESEAGK